MNLGTCLIPATNSVEVNPALEAQGRKFTIFDSHDEKKNEQN